MKHVFILVFAALFIFAFVFTAFGQSQNEPPEFNLNFEKIPDKTKLPDGWSPGGNGYTVRADNSEKKSGTVSLSIEPDSADKLDKTLGVAVYKIPANYAGEEIELRGFLKYKDVTGGFAGLYLRIDDENGRPLALDNMQSRKLSGTTDWMQYSIKLPLSAEDAKFIVVGALLTGKGKIWVDDMQVFIDGKNISEIKPLPPIVYKASSDKAFDGGSKIVINRLNKSKIENLAVLGRVWGFLKYHHPAIARGDYNWDYELFRILPKILAAKNPAERNEILANWADSLGAFEISEGQKIESSQIELSPDWSWLNAKTLGDRLFQQLNRIKTAKRPDKNYYIGFMKNIGNPQFKNEEAYKTMTYPDAGFRLLGLFRYWNIIQYFFPYRHLIGEDWNKVLADSIPAFVNSADELEYKKSALRLIGRIHDTHANIWGLDKTLDKFRGINLVPVRTSFVENKAVVIGYWEQNLGEKTGLKIGDIIESVNGKKVSNIVEERLPFNPASNRPTQLRDIGNYLFETNENFLTIKYKRDNKTQEIKAEAYPKDKLKIAATGLYSKPAVAFKLLAPDIAYLYPGALKRGEVAQLIPEIAKTKGLVIDLRSYPSDFIVFSLGEFLTPEPKDFVRFAFGSIATPGFFFINPKSLQVGKENPDYYKGKVIILVNEITQSNAEYTTMAFRIAPGATVIGSTTAGADGNVSQFFLPGGINTQISGIGIYYPDGKETQRVGIVPDLVIKPTIKGIKNGKDELLDKAIEIINSK